MEILSLAANVTQLTAFAGSTGEVLWNLVEVFRKGPPSFREHRQNVHLLHQVVRQIGKQDFLTEEASSSVISLLVEIASLSSRLLKETHLDSTRTYLARVVSAPARQAVVLELVHTLDAKRSILQLLLSQDNRGRLLNLNKHLEQTKEKAMRKKTYKGNKNMGSMTSKHGDIEVRNRKVGPRATGVVGTGGDSKGRGGLSGKITLIDTEVEEESHDRVGNIDAKYEAELRKTLEASIGASATATASSPVPPVTGQDADFGMPLVVSTEGVGTYFVIGRSPLREALPTGAYQERHLLTAITKDRDMEDCELRSLNQLRAPEMSLAGLQ